MARFSSPREALRVYFAARRGPRASRPRWDGMPSARAYRPPDDEVWVTVGHLLHVDCGVEIGSPEERAVRRWVEGVEERTYSVRYVEEKMRRLLRKHGLMPQKQKVKKDEEDGVEFARLVEGGGE